MNKVLLFDYDGTILDSLDVVWRGFVHAAEKEGIKFRTKKEFASFYKKNVYQSFLEAGVKKNRLEQFVNEMSKVYKSEQKKTKLFKGMKKIVNNLSKNNFVYIITSNMSNSIRKSIKEHELKGIKDVLGGDKGKSKVDKINRIKKKYPKSEIFYIGDTKGDALEARKAGVKSIAVAWGYHSRKVLETAKPDYLITKPEQLIKILDL